MREKLKSLVLSDHSFYSLLVIVVGILGYVLGGGQVVNNYVTEPVPVAAPAPKTLKSQTAAAAIAPSLKASDQAVVGSKSGTKYHLPDCPGAAQIKPENRVEFASVAMAEAAGYKPASNCPGLVQ